MNQMPTNFTPSDDGFETVASEAADRVIKGTLIKFSDGTWTAGKEAILMKPDVRLVVVSTAAAWVQWVGGKPVKYLIQRPGTPMPEREQLGDTDDALWEAGPDGSPRDPWQSTKFAHFTDPLTASLYTWSATSWSGRGAIVDLSDAVSRYRQARPGACPVVLLEAAPMQTKYGMKRKPVLNIIDWVGSGTPPKPAPQMKTITNNAPPRPRADMDDGIPF
jgi:hypothetical protein